MSFRWKRIISCFQKVVNDLLEMILAEVITKRMSLLHTYFGTNISSNMKEEMAVNGDIFFIKYVRLTIWHDPRIFVYICEILKNAATNLKIYT